MPTNLDEKLAEEIGIFIGDGYLSDYSYHWELGICGHLVDDYEYITKYVNPLMNELFGSPGSIVISQAQRAVNIRFWSKAIFLYHSAVLGLPIGEKKDLLEIPKQVLSSPVLAFSCIRGIADTDATLTFKRKYKRLPYYPSIKIELASQKIVEQVALVLQRDFRLLTIYNMKNRDGYVTHRIELNGVENLEKWMKLIGFRNPKHLSKYVFWRKNGFYLPSFTSERLRMLTTDEVLWKSPVAYLSRRKAILECLSMEPLSIAVLARKTSTHRNSVYSTLKRLEEIGLVVKREVNWHITKDGLEYLQRPDSLLTQLLKSGGAAGI